MSEHAAPVESTLKRIVREETSGLHPRLLYLYARNALLRRGSASAKRAQLMRNAGFTIGDGTQFMGVPYITGSAAGKHPDAGEGLFTHLHIGRDCRVDIGIVFDLEEHIRIGDNVVLGTQVMILTSTHELGPKEHRAGPITRAPVVIETGAWLGARSVILPGVTIGEGAVVNPGSVVNKDVPPHTRVGGIPAKKIDVFAEAE